MKWIWVSPKFEKKKTKKKTTLMDLEIADCWLKYNLSLNGDRWWWSFLLKKMSVSLTEKATLHHNRSRRTVSVYISALTNDANIPSSCSKRISGLSYSKMFPRFITMTRSAVRMVWTRCWKHKATVTISHINNINVSHTYSYSCMNGSNNWDFFLSCGISLV